MPRTLRIGDTGPAVEAAKRSVYKYLERKMPVRPTAVRRFFGIAFQSIVKDAQRKMNLPQSGVIGPKTWGELDESGSIDNYSTYLLQKDEAGRPLLVFPFPIGANVATCQGLHPTAGLYGNWAMDWCCVGGTPVVAVEKAKIKKLSGRNPALGADQFIGIFGWSIHYETAAGYRYFSTHYGEREPLVVGQWVEAGQKVGEVGWWPGNPGRSHLHLGVTSPEGEADAKKRISAVNDAQRVRAT